MATNKLIKTSPHRRIVARDLPTLTGKVVVSANVGTYMGPGWNPRIIITERRIYIESVEPTGKGEQDWIFHCCSRSKTKTRRIILGAELVNGKEGVTYWILDPTISSG